MLERSTIMSVFNPIQNIILQIAQRRLILIAIAFSFAIAPACAAPPAHQDGGTLADTAPSDVDASDVSNDERDAAKDGADVIASDDDVPTFHENHPRPDESTWLCDENSSPIDYLPINEPFELPDNDFGYTPYTAESYLNKFGGSGARSGKSMLPSPDHALYASQVDAFAANEGDDVTLHLALWRNGGPFDHARLSGTVLVEYQPVEATFKIWDDERKNVTYETTDTGIDAPVDTEVVLVDITIPSGVFVENGAHELSMFLQVASPGTTHVAVAWRTFVYYGAYSRFSHPCFPRTTSTEITDEELAVLETLHHVTSLHLYPEGETGDEIKSIHQVGPGETVTLKYFKTTQWTTIAQPVVLQPLLSGRPIGEPTYLYPPISNGSGGATNFREELVIEMPQEPGLYPVTIAGFDDAHLLMRDHNGIGYNVFAGGLGSSTNTVWYEVVDGQ
jgi:hypothetical protein